MFLELKVEMFHSLEDAIKPLIHGMICFHVQPLEWVLGWVWVLENQRKSTASGLGTTLAHSPLDGFKHYPPAN